MYESITTFLKSNHKLLSDANQRLTIVLHGEANDEHLIDFMADLIHGRKLIISPVIKGAVEPKLAATKLGEEYDLVIFDARDVFNPDALGVVSGVLCGGGCLLLLLPELNKWNNSESLFFKHVSNLLLNQPGVYYLKCANSKLDDFVLHKANTALNIENTQNLTTPYKSEDQREAVESIVKLLHGNSKKCCVLTSGRGRGKSSALGFIASELLTNNKCELLISAPKLSVTKPMFFHLKKQCPDGYEKRAEFRNGESRLKFIAPDALLEKLPKADVLLIDEAAVIPLSMLRILLQHYSKIIFSTTTHGYEGTGRGFALKFYQLLDKEKPGWEKIELHQPIRWSIDDPLENWIESLLFLNVKLQTKPAIPKNILQCEFSLLDRSKLLNNPKKMASIFSLLVFTHYRTSPSDFQYLLDSEDIRIYSLEFNDNSLAVLVVNQEGEFDSYLSTSIYRGERRPLGNLLAQTLCFHGGCESAAELKYARVMRIAVHPDNQLMGLGSYLLQQVIESERVLGVDIIGSSFSATPQLLDFWNKAGLSILRMGFSRDHVTASNSAVMAKSLTSKGSKVVDQLKAKFKSNISIWLLGPLSNLSEEIKSHRFFKCNLSAYSSDDYSDVVSFARFNRNYDACLPAIIRYINSKSSDITKLNDSDQDIIFLSLKYMTNLKLIVLHSKNMSKSQAVEKLRSALSNLLLINQ